MNELAFNMLWEDLREEMMKADLYKKRNEMIRDGKKFRTLLKDGSLTETIDTDRMFKLAEQQDKHYKKTMFYTGLLKAMNKKEENENDNN